jgi:hypothetical protein
MSPELLAMYEDNFGWREDTDPEAHIRHVTALAEQYPDQPMVANELTNAYFRAGQIEEGKRRGKETRVRFPDSIPLAANSILLIPTTEHVLAEAGGLSEDLEITHFPAWKDGYYSFIEFVLHEHAAICIQLARGGWELAHLRFERLLRIGMAEMLWKRIAEDFVGHFLNNLEQFSEEHTDGLPAPNTVVGAPMASIAVKKGYSEALVRIMNSQGGTK